jgi:hypothetical protein
MTSWNCAGSGSVDQGPGTICRSSVRRKLIMIISRSYSVNPLCCAYPASVSQAPMNAWISGPMVSCVVSIAAFSISGHSPFTSSRPCCLNHVMIRRFRRFGLRASTRLPLHCPDNEQREACASDHFKHGNIRIHRITPFSRSRR